MGIAFLKVGLIEADIPPETSTSSCALPDIKSNGPHSFEGWLPTLRGYGELAKPSSTWLQFIWLAVGSTMTTRHLVNLINNSIPTAPTKLLQSARLIVRLGNKKPFGNN